MWAIIKQQWVLGLGGMQYNVYAFGGHAILSALNGVHSEAFHSGGLDTCGGASACKFALSQGRLKTKKITSFISICVSVTK
jgi:hypothetical protein